VLIVDGPRGGCRPGQLDLLATTRGAREDQPLALGVHAEVLPSDLTPQVEGLLGQAAPGQLEFVLGHARGPHAAGAHRAVHLRRLPGTAARGRDRAAGL
jgi:hypothetical protein